MKRRWHWVFLALFISTAAGAPSGIGAVEERVAAMRGLKFRGPVRYAYFEREKLREILEQKLDRQYSAEELRRMGVSLEALGLIERGYPLRAKFLDLLQEQVLAFYDQHCLYMLKGARPEQNDAVLAHELVHALQDQHFNLGALGLEDKGNDDRVLAANALVEGDATLVMAEFAGSRPGVSASNAHEIHKAPRWLRQTLLFPYLHGQRFCSELRQRGYSLSELYKRPPLSSSQVLHPAKYLANERPVEVQDLGPELFYSNVLGEFGTRILLAECLGAESAESAAEGWRGDRYVLYNKGADLVWKSAWDSDQDAQEFTQALRRYWAGRSRSHWNVYRTGYTVVLVDSDSEMNMDALVRRFVGAGVKLQE